MESREKKKKKRKPYEEDNGFAQWGGYMAAKKSKLSKQFCSKANDSVAESKIFQGVSIFVNGYTNPTAEELKKIMIEYGGTYHHYYRHGSTTHIIATMLPHTKIKKLTDEKVVKPEWITDSVEAGKLLPYSNYLLYMPWLRKGQTKLVFETYTSISEQHNVATSSSEVNGKSKLVNLLDKDQIQFGDKSYKCSSEESEFSTTSKLHEGNMFQTDFESSIGSEDLNSGFKNYFNKQSNNENTKPSTSFDRLYLEDSSSSNDLASLPSTSVTGIKGNSSSGGKKTGLEENIIVNNSMRVNQQDDSSSIKIVTDDETATKKIMNVLQDNSLLEESSEIIAEKTSKKHVGIAGEVNFLSEYYSHSRLHHISNASSEFKMYVRQLQNQHRNSFSGRDKLLKEVQSNSFNAPGCSKWKHKVIMHIDMDCFFVSVGLLKRPDLLGKPVAVAHSRGNNVPERPGTDPQFEMNYYQNRHNKRNSSPLKTNKTLFETNNTTLENIETLVELESLAALGSTSEISSCSYEARKAGVTSRMFLGEALKRCPDLKTIPYDFEEYTRVSKTLYETMASYTLQIEAISCDEMFVDCTEILETCGVSPLDLAQHLRKEIELKTGCTASAGLGSNLLIARLATRKAKPNGQCYIPPEENWSFMHSQRVEDLPGVGHSTGAHLRALEVQDCAQLQGLSLEKLQKEFGPKSGKNLYEQCRGVDHRVVLSEKVRKSVSAEVNYGMRFKQIEEAEGFLKEIAEEVEKRLKAAEKIGCQLTLKLKVRAKDAPVETTKFLGHGVCDNVTRSTQLPIATDSAEIIAKECCSALRAMKVAACDIRGMGIQITRLNEAKSKQNVKTLEHFLQNQATSIKCDPVIKNNVKNSESSRFDQPSTSRSAVNKEWFPSPSQIDPDVWRALPQDIQSQLASEYKIHDSGIRANAPKNLPSDSKEASVHGLPHYSQLDVSVFDALPEDIRHEVLEAYTTKTKDSTSCVDNNKLKKSPVKSPLKRKYRKRKLPGTNLLKNGQNLDKIISPVKNASVSDVIPNIEPHRADLCGAVELAEVKLLIKEWIASTKGPLEDDVNLFIKYILEVVSEKNLEKLDLILKGFFRYISESGNDDWKVVYLEVLENMQPRIQKLYGCALKVPTF